VASSAVCGADETALQADDSTNLRAGEGGQPTGTVAPQPALTPRLDGGTKLGVGAQGRYYPAAGEGVVWSTVLEGDHDSSRALGPRLPPDSLNDDPAPPMPIPDDHAERASRRAKGQVRRYAVANGLTRLVTLTRADQTHDVATVNRAVVWFLRQLRERYPDVGYVRVFERHQSGAVHVHLGISRYIAKGEIAALWPHGFVDVRKMRSSRPGGREAARLTARYLAKYVVKEAVRANDRGHRYEVRQGRQPVAVRVWAQTMRDGLRELIRASGGETPSYVWDSASQDDWRGPPVLYAAWG
jgi:hypothetical protein